MRSLFAVVLATVLAAVACGGETTILSGQDVVSTIPWPARETARYRLSKGDEVKGTAELRLESQADVINFTQSFHFPDEELTDGVLVVVEIGTLRPRSVERLIRGPEGDRHCQAEYAGGLATVSQSSPEGERTDELDVPARSYDSWSDLFLWRTLAFAKDWEARYVDVLTCSLAKPQLLSVELKVKALESVSVPAGTFEAWRLEIRSGGRTQKAWYADDAERTLVRYDNGELVFELLSQ